MPGFHCRPAVLSFITRMAEHLDGWSVKQYGEMPTVSLVKDAGNGYFYRIDCYDYLKPSRVIFLPRFPDPHGDVISKLPNRKLVSITLNRDPADAAKDFERRVLANYFDDFGTALQLLTVASKRREVQRATRDQIRQAIAATVGHKYAPECLDSTPGRLVWRHGQVDLIVNVDVNGTGRVQLTTTSPELLVALARLAAHYAEPKEAETLD